MERVEAIKLLKENPWNVQAGEKYTIDYFKPSDAPGIARLFYAVYGDAYPIDTCYIPERLVEENRLGNILSTVARTASGDIISHIALYRSSSPNPNLYECGLGLTLPAYRSSIAYFRANELLLKLAGTGSVDGFYAETVCNHIITQKHSKHVRAVETAVEPALMPGETYEIEHRYEGRVGCIFYFRVDRDCRRTLYLPLPYINELTTILDGLNLDREILTSSDDFNSGSGGEIDVKRFDFAGVARCMVLSPGEGIPTQVAALEQELQNGNYAMIQFFLDLGKPWSGGVVKQLRQCGFSFGGLLPIWFGSDGLLMQKHFVDPDFEGMKILTDRGNRLFEIVRGEWERMAG